MYGIALPKVYKFVVTATDNAGFKDTAPVCIIELVLVWRRHIDQISKIAATIIGSKLSHIAWRYFAYANTKAQISAIVFAM